MRWKVGNGKSIQVQGDAWLDGPGSGWIISPRRELAAEATVDMFIDHENKVWKEDLVREVFLPFEANKILRIPISCISSEDEIWWTLSSDGIFRGKDAHSHAIDNREFASCSKGPYPILARL